MATTVLERHPLPKYPRLTVQLRSNSKFYQAVTYLDGKLRQASVKTTHLPTAFKLAEDWYKREARASVAFGRQHPIQQLTTDATLAELYRSYVAELGKPQRAYAAMKWGPIADFWRARTLSTVSTHTFKEFYAWRRKGKSLKNHTLHKDVVLLRQVLKHALNNELLDHLPHIPPVGKIEANPRPWLTKNEWEHLRRVARKRIDDAPNQRTRQQRQDVYDLMMFLLNSMLRVDELYTLRFSACRVDKNKDGDQMLLCEVTGKRGTRTVVAQRGAVWVYEARLKAAKSANDTSDLMFPHRSTDACRELLEAAGLRRDRFGFTRNLKSLRATSISFRLLDQPDLNLQIIARNAGTSVQMIDQFYAKRLTAEMHKEALSKLPADAFRKPTKAQAAKTLERLRAQMRKEREP
jgi:integrase